MDWNPALAALFLPGSSATDAAPAPGFGSDLFEVFTPRRQCMNFEADVVWTHAVADALIALSYFSIPVALVYFVRRRQDLAFNWMFLMFAGFITACGTTHVFGVWDLWQPLYRLDGAVKALTAVISVATAVLLWRLLPDAIALPSPAQLRSANAKLELEIKERQEAQERLRSASHELEQRVQERTAELGKLAEERQALLASERVARGEAERANRTKDEFVATLSHELRTPISAILGWTQQLSLARNDEDIERGLQAIERNTRAQVRLIDDLLDMSRIVSGKLRLDVSTLDLSQVVEAALDSVRPAAEAKEIRVTCELDPRAGLVRADANRLQQVIWNLLSNAIKFTPQGGNLWISSKRVDSQAELTVADDGQGIDPDFLPHLFERFRQANSSTTRAFGGLGLGLSIVKNLVELHGGTVRAESAGEGRGAAFVVTLPLAAQPRADAALPHSKPTDLDPGLQGLCVLVVDDDPDWREVVGRMLTDRGAEVLLANSAEQAREALIASRPDVLISDIGLPNRDGYELIRDVRRLAPEQGGRTPAIALTAFARTEDRTRALLAGYQAHIAKPMEIRELVAMIATLTGRTGTE